MVPKTKIGMTNLVLCIVERLTVFKKQRDKNFENPRKFIFIFIHNVNPSQCSSARPSDASRRSREEMWLREALLPARRGPVVHRATNLYRAPRSYVLLS